MEVFALFDDKNAEKVNLEFLQPYSKGERVDITYLSSVPDNIKESADKGIKEAYILSSKYIQSIPDKISVWFRGFETGVQGNSTDLAFAAALIAHFAVPQNSSQTKIISATGVIGKNSDIKGITGLKNKIIAAAKVSKENVQNILLFPAENLSELHMLIESDSDLELEIKRNNLTLVPVKTLKEVFDALGLKNEQKYSRKSISIILLIVIIPFISVAVYLNKNNIPGVGATEKPSVPIVQATPTHITNTFAASTDAPVTSTPEPQTLSTTGVSYTNTPLVSTPRLPTSTPVKSSVQATVTPLNDAPWPYKEFNDGNIKFQYPNGWVFSPDSNVDSELTSTKTAWNRNIMIEVKYASYFFSPYEKYTDTTLDGIHKHILNADPLTPGNVIQRCDDCVLIKGTEYHNYIYARGIGNVVPRISINAAPEDSKTGRVNLKLPVTDADIRLLTDITETIRKSITVINPTEPIRN